MDRDFLDEMIAKRTRANPGFPARIKAARAERVEQRATLRATLEAARAPLPEPADEEHDEISSRRSEGA